MRFDDIKKLPPEIQPLALEIHFMGVVVRRIEKKVDDLLNGVEILEQEENTRAKAEVGAERRQVPAGTT